MLSSGFRKNVRLCGWMHLQSSLDDDPDLAYTVLRYQCSLALGTPYTRKLPTFTRLRFDTIPSRSQVHSICLSLFGPYGTKPSIDLNNMEEETQHLVESRDATKVVASYIIVHHPTPSTWRNPLLIKTSPRVIVYLTLSCQPISHPQRRITAV